MINDAVGCGISLFGYRRERGRFCGGASEKTRYGLSLRQGRPLIVPAHVAPARGALAYRSSSFIEPSTHAALSTASAPKNFTEQATCSSAPAPARNARRNAPAPRHAMALPIQARRRRPPSRLALLFAVCKCSDALTLSRRPLRQTRRTQLKMMDEVECDVAIGRRRPGGVLLRAVYS